MGNELMTRRRLVVSNIVSLDGYVEGPGGDVMALPMDPFFDEYNLERLRAADTLLLGARTYVGLKGYWPGVADNPELSPAVAANPDVADIHRETGRRNNEIAKVVVSDSLREEDAAGLVDELHLMLGASVLGGGTPAFGAGPIPPLRLLDCRPRTDSSNVLLRVRSRLGSVGQARSLDATARWR